MEEPSGGERHRQRDAEVVRVRLNGAARAPLLQVSLFKHRANFLVVRPTAGPGTCVVSCLLTHSENVRVDDSKLQRAVAVG